MAKNYFLDVKQIIDTLSEDKEPMLEEKLVLLQLMDSYIARIMEGLEKKLTLETGDQTP